ncbi:MAG: hypothetical protein ACTSO7_10850 [Candidatus Heimdallarchaeota archaeon]
MTRKRNYLQIVFFTIILVGILVTSSSVFGADEPITKEYLLPGQSWKFIEETNFTEYTSLDYEWRCAIEIQGVGVTKADFELMQGMGLSELSTYFEQLAYFEGKTDTGKLTSDEDGSLYFVFFNPELSQATLTITYTYRTNILPPWAIGLIISVVTIIVLSVAFYYAIKLRNKMINEAIDAADDAEKQTPEQRYLG